MWKQCFKRVNKRCAFNTTVCLIEGIYCDGLLIYVYNHVYFGPQTKLISTNVLVVGFPL